MVTCKRDCYSHDSNLILQLIFICEKIHHALGNVSTLTIEGKTENKNRLPNEVQIRHFIEKNDDEFTKQMTTTYAKPIYDNDSKNRNKAIAVLIGQCTFLVSIIFAFILIVVLIQAFRGGEFSLPSSSSAISK